MNRSKKLHVGRKYLETPCKEKNSRLEHQLLWKVTMKSSFSRHSVDVNKELHTPIHKKRHVTITKREGILFVKVSVSIIDFLIHTEVMQIVILLSMKT